MPFDLSGQHVVVSGAASGIGRAVSLALLAAGARVSALDNDERELSRLLASECGLEAYACDVTQPELIESVLESLERKGGGVTGLVHSAGCLSLGSLMDPEFTIESFERMMRVNVRGSWLLMRAVAARMKRQRQAGSLVVVSSNAASTPRVKMGGYCASKAGVTMLMHCLALELAEFGIRCNAVSPGSTNTPMLRNLGGETAVSASVQGDPANFRLGIPLGKVAEPEDIAEACLFFLSKSSGHVTGHDLRVDGGATWS